MTVASVEFDIFARDRASKPIADVGQSAETSGTKLAEMGRRAQESAGSLSTATGQVRKSTEEAASGFDRASAASDNAEEKFEGIGYTLSGSMGLFAGVGQVAGGDLAGGLVTAAMGGADLAQGIRKSVLPALQAMTLSNLQTAIATGTSTVSMVAHKVASIATSGATKAMAATQWLLNAAMTANPIGLVVVAIAALTAGLIIAYKNSETFRNIVDGAFKAIAAAGRWMWNSVLAPVIRFLINGFATVAGGIASMLDALGNIPGFGWAKDAAAKMRGAADAASGLASKITNIPDANVNVHVGLSGPGVALLHKSVASKRPDVYYSERAAGGPVRSGQPYLVGENADGSVNRTTEMFVPDSAGQILNARQTRSMLRSGGGALAGGGGETHVHVYIDGREVRTSLRRVDRIDGGGTQ